MKNSEPFIDVATWAGEREELDKTGGLHSTWHRYDEASLHAINTALAADRPLLVRGEPGTGKSQLARAAAQRLGRNYVWRVMDARAKVSDLFFDFDAVERLAQAQVAGALCHGEGGGQQSVEAFLDERNFVRPGPLWWAFDRSGARAWERHVKCRDWTDRSPGQNADEEEEEQDDRPYVVLIDEIDKTDPSVPNGLLEVLGQGTFPVKKGTRVSLNRNQRPPLIIITTNDERELPGAFLRRCIVYPIVLPKPEQGLESWLVERGRTHFKDLSDRLLVRAATQLCVDRKVALGCGLVPPGQAEYLDLLRAVRVMCTDDGERDKLLDKIARFTFKKHPELYDNNSAEDRG